MNEEERQLQVAIALSRDEYERRGHGTAVQDDYEAALQLQEEEFAEHTSSRTRRKPLSRMFDALSNTFAAPGRVCDVCQKKVHGPGVTSGGRMYHVKCYRRRVQEKCRVCHQPLCAIGSRNKVSEHPFWKEKYCHYHDMDGTPRCSSCEQMKPVDARWVILSDGREICVDCSRTMIVETNSCEALYSDVLELYRSLQLALPSRPPLGLVDRQALNEQTPVHGHGGTAQTRGMTLAEEHRHVQTVYRRRGPIFGQPVDAYPVERRECRVTAILILFGLPRLLTGSILAHECMHAYLKFANKTDLAPFVEEGLCQLMAYLWIEHQRPEDPFEKRLASFIANQIRLHPSPTYGDGFRMALASFQCYGLPSLINHIRLTGLFPEPQ